MTTNSEHKCPTIGEKLSTLEESLVLQFRTATPEQAATLSAAVHQLKKLTDKLYKKHDAVVDMLNNGEFGYKCAVKRIRAERADKVAKAADEFSTLDF